MKIYIPFISFEYSNILSMFSIAPPQFYKKRNYGYNNFTPSFLSPSKEYLFGYSKPVFLQRGAADADDSFTINLEIDTKPAGLDEIKKVHDIRVFKIAHTVYLDENSGFLFKNEDDIKKAHFIAERAKDAKFHPWAKIKNRLLNEDEALNEFDRNDLADINLEANESIDKQVKIDGTHNKLLGVLLGHAVGQKMNIDHPVTLEIGDIVRNQHMINQYMVNYIAHLTSKGGKIDKKSMNELKALLDGQIKTHESLKSEIKDKIRVNTSCLDFTADTKDFLHFRFCDSETREGKIFELLLNYFLALEPMKRIEELHSNAVSQIRDGGQYLRKRLGEAAWENKYSNVRDYMLDLWNSVKTRQLNHKVENAQSDALKAFTVLLTTGRSLDKYIDELIFKHKVKPEIGMAMYGAVFGIADIPKDLTAPYLTQSDNSLQFIRIMKEVREEYFRLTETLNTDLDKDQVNEIRISSEHLSRINNLSLPSRIWEDDKTRVREVLLNTITVASSRPGGLQIATLDATLSQLKKIRHVGPKTIDEIKEELAQILSTL